MTATVIKSGASGRGPHASAFNFDDLTTQAEKYLGEIRQQAAKMIADAQRQADAIRAQAEQQGRQAAVDAAERVLDEKVGKQMATALPAVRKAVEHLEQSRAALVRQWESNIVHLAARIAAKVIRRETVAAPQITFNLLREALELAVGGGRLTIRIHPSDHATLGVQIDRLVGEMARLGKVQIVADHETTPGGCRVETDFGVIDQTFEAQLARIEEELT
jgi:flagellar biosynthesis/type III secretory pathway protein FliH